jgi:hypothetical protein
MVSGSSEKLGTSASGETPTAVTGSVVTSYRRAASVISQMSAVPLTYRRAMVSSRALAERIERLCTAPLDERTLREQTSLSCDGSWVATPTCGHEGVFPTVPRHASRQAGDVSVCCRRR